ncbi:hypothetical protein BAY61_18975 [Prauserella marina]|uniref:3-hydroxyisobutyrate dehydrogenase n=1 Tax=Prauserella marina TaxID=530584 RepID=A0A222VS59_9PSEU|nr:NAD(P)-binding domain-containing protein [Prauserella marina]ASR36738.1 hypothetical protein BAY61_18975 [Prauserella marina]PWV80379.1 3-hydroxyisobutyrate dehydrogenase-like beta-hydroxyacid dehydrogenase [Prauserella marina]SDD53058.1 3-hydroxyisobutyrate dehydrogenase [Prauserella marina]
MTTTARTPVTVLGLGEMGTALATAFLDGGHPTTVWNRTRDRTGPLVAKGARAAATVAEAVAASPLIVVNVKGNDVARELLESAGEAITGRAVLNLTDGTSAEARSLAGWAADHDVEYLHGQLMTIAPGIGHPGTTVFLGGSPALAERLAPELALLGGKTGLVSEDPGVPVLYGMAVHGTMWGALNGFLHAAAILTSEGLAVERFLDHAGPSVTAMLSQFPSIAGEVDRADYAAEYGALRHHLPSVSDLVAESRDHGVATALADHTLELVSTAVAEGHDGDNYSRIVESFRRTR